MTLDLTPYVIAWRTTPLRDREVVDALIHPAHAGPSEALDRALRGWEGSYYWSDEPGGRWLVLTRPRPATGERWWLHALLFLATLATTTLAGAVLAGAMEDSFAPFRGRLGVTAAFLHSWSAGLQFSLPLLAILLAHEMGHYVTAKRYQLDVSPPYFIPMPILSFIGTLGAFIRLRTILSDRRQLFDVGFAGPIAGFVVAVPVLLLGLALSHPVSPHEGVSGMMLLVGADRIPLGDSPVTLLARWAVRGDLGPVAIHPLAFAGVIGMFVTMINLMPMAQLDGGHVLYATVPRWHRRVALVFWVVVLGLGRWWAGWFVWAGLVLLVSRGRLDHPVVLDAYRPLPRSRRRLAWAALALFLLTFAPAPFRL
jgi:membrane-associated protease RseP (regulator of RpoE activity)